MSRRTIGLSLPSITIRDRMNDAELRALGEASGRRGWQTHLADSLPSLVPGKTINPRTVRRWLAGKAKIHPALEEPIRLALKPKQRKEKL